MGLFKKIKNALAKTRDNFQRKMDNLFSKGEIDDEFYEELEDIMISSDVGVKTTMEISNELAKRVHKEKIRTADDARALLKDIIPAPFHIKGLVRTHHHFCMTVLIVIEATGFEVHCIYIYI